MGKFSGVLLATDYDDTLYDSKGTISPENRAAIDRFLAEGGLVRVDLDGETLWVRPAYDYQSTPYDRMYDICQEWAEYASFLQDISSSARP